MTKRELARWVAWFAKLTGRSIPEAMDYLERRGKEAETPRLRLYGQPVRPGVTIWLDTNVLLFFGPGISPR